MGSVLQFAVFLYICWLIRGVVTQPNQDDNKRLTDKPPNQNDPGERDFYFEEQRTNDDNIKTGRVIPQSAWSKEEKEQTETVVSKNGTQSNDEFSLTNFLSYMLNMVQELKKDIFGIKEMASSKNKEELVNSQDNFADKNKQNKMEIRNDAPKSGDSPEYKELKSKNQQRRSNYLTGYYQKNGIKFDDDEEDDDLESSSDQSDDSSHQPNEEVNIQEINTNNQNRNHNDDPSHKPNSGTNKQGISKNNKNTYTSKCVRITRKPDLYSSEVEKITTIPSSQTEMTKAYVKKYDDNKENRKNNNFEESTTKPFPTEQNNFKSSKKEIENMSTVSSNSKIGRCVKKNNRNSSNNLNEKNNPAEKPLKSVEYVTTNSPKNKNAGETSSKRSNQNKTPDNLSKSTLPSTKNPGKDSKNKGVLNLDNKSGVHVQSTTLPSQNSKDFIYPENGGNTNEPYTLSMFSEKPAYRKQKEQNTSPKSADEKQFQNIAKSFKTADRTNEHATVSTTDQRMSTKAYTLDSEINDRHKESEDKKLNVISSRTTITYNENEPNSKSEGQQNNFDDDNTIQSTTSGTIMNMDNLNKNLSDNFTDEKETNKNDESEKLNINYQDKDDSENKKDNGTEQPKEQQSKNDSESEISLKNKKNNDSKPENDIKEVDDNFSSTTPSYLQSSQDSKSEFRNHDFEGFGKPQEQQESNEDLSEKDYVYEISADYEYEYEDDTEDFDISDELRNSEDNQNQESEVSINNGKDEHSDEVYPGNTTITLISESQTSQQTGYEMKEKSQEQYDTLLEYIYKNSNNPFFLSLKDQSNDSSHGQD